MSTTEGPPPGARAAQGGGEPLAALAEHWRAELGENSNPDVRTHWEGCEREHWRCALSRMVEFILAPPRAEPAERENAIDMLCAIAHDLSEEGEGWFAGRVNDAIAALRAPAAHPHGEPAGHHPGPHR